MLLLSTLDLSLPLKNPVIIFSLVLFIILFAPIVFNRLKIPHIIGLIIAGVIIGPHGLNILLRDSSIVLFGTVGLLYIMFVAGLEIDMEEFKKTRLKSLVFGLFTFAIPLLAGSLAARYILGFSLFPAILFGSMLSTHTLLAYPIVSKYGIARIRAVTLTIGGTIVTDILSLLVLAAITGMTRGDIGPAFWIKLAIGCLLFGGIVFYLFPLIARWFFKKYEDHISQYIFVLAMVFLGSFLAELAGLEAIIGAFLSGLALNRFIPHVSPLMNRIEFVGNAVFIPFFLIGVGMLVDISVLFKGWGAILVAVVMIIVAVSSKFLAAWFTQKSFKLSGFEKQLIFGLSNARVGATLAIVLIGYNIIVSETADGEPIRLLSEDVLNGTILMILVTCTISSLVVEKAAKAIVFQTPEEHDTASTINQKILISLAYPDTVAELVDVGLMLKPHSSAVPVYALHVTLEEQLSGGEASSGKKILEQALKHATGTSQTLIPISRHDVNISHGIIYSIKEKGITDVLIGLHHASDRTDFFGPTAEKILRTILETIYIYKPIQPFNTLQRMVVVVPPNAEEEEGFLHWFQKLNTVARAAGVSLFYFASDRTITALDNAASELKHTAKMLFSRFTDWHHLQVLQEELRANDWLVMISSRKGRPSHHAYLEQLPLHLSNTFQDKSTLIIYPKQLATTESESDFT